MEDGAQRQGVEKAKTADRTTFVKENKVSTYKLPHHGICRLIEQAVESKLSSAFAQE